MDMSTLEDISRELNFLGSYCSSSTAIGRKTSMPKPTAKELLSTDEAAAFIGESSQTLRLWRTGPQDGCPKFVILNGQIAYNRSDLIQWVVDSQQAKDGRVKGPSRQVYLVGDLEFARFEEADAMAESLAFFKSSPVQVKAARGDTLSQVVIKEVQPDIELVLARIRQIERKRPNSALEVARVGVPKVIVVAVSVKPPSESTLRRWRQKARLAACGVLS